MATPRKGTAAARAPSGAAAPQAGPLARIFGIRHLSPMGAWSLERFLERTDPTAVLVEGPSDATDTIVHLADKRTQPPVALLAFTEQRPVRSILYPLASYSPEWVALTWAIRNKRLARFIDLPAETFLALDRSGGGEADPSAPPGAPPPAEARPPAPPEAAAPAADTRAYLDDPYEAIARLSGDPDHETWWEKHFEHLLDADAYRDSIHEFGAGLRELDRRGTRHWQETLLREAFMRRAIRDTLAEGHDPERVVVVCGAFHAPVLTAEEPAMTDEELKKLPRVKTVLTLMPYSYYRLSSQSGYGAGNGAPGYFQALWEEARSGSTGRLGPRYLSAVAGKLRSAGTVRSSAEVIEAVRLANTLVALRGDAPAPSLRDLRDAAVTCLGHGDAAVVGRWLDDVSVGDSIGKVPPGVLRTALQDDFYRQVKDLRLEEYLKDKEQLIKGATGKEWLDLREDRFAKTPEVALRDRNRSIFLHRLSLLAITFATPKTTERDRAESTYKEIWAARWTPECEIALAENALRGDSVELAAVRKLQEDLAAVRGVKEAAELARRSVECDLPDGTAAALARVQALAVDAADFVSLAGAAMELALLTRYRDVRKLDVAPLKPLVAQLFLRATLMAPQAARCAPDAASRVGRGLADVQQVALITDDGSGGLDTGRWARVLDGIADDDLAHAHVAGVACALLLEQGLVTDEVLDRRVARRIFPGTDPVDAAGFFEGLATRNRHVLLSRKSLWAAMTRFVEALDDEAFRRAVVGLRRAFAGFEVAEARRIAGILAELWGGGGDALVKAIETKVDDAELSKLQSDLEGLEDLDL